MGILAPGPGIQPTPRALEGKVVTHWISRENPRILNFTMPPFLAFLIQKVLEIFVHRYQHGQITRVCMELSSSP